MIKSNNWVNNYTTIFRFSGSTDIVVDQIKFHQPFGADKDIIAKNVAALTSLLNQFEVESMVELLEVVNTHHIAQFQNYKWEQGSPKQWWDDEWIENGEFSELNTVNIQIAHIVSVEYVPNAIFFSTTKTENEVETADIFSLGFRYKNQITYSTTEVKCPHYQINCVDGTTYRTPSIPESITKAFNLDTPVW